MGKELFGLKDENGKEYKLLIESFSDGIHISKVLPVEAPPKFDIGEWVIWTGSRPTIGRIIGRCDLFPDSWALDVYKKTEKEYSSCCGTYLRKANSLEIQQHLLDVATQKGFINGAKFIPINSIIEIRTLERSKEWWYSGDKDTLFVCTPSPEWKNTCSNPQIYSNGVWAHLLPEKKKYPKTKEEAIEFLTGYAQNGNMMNFLQQYEK